MTARAATAEDRIDGVLQLERYLGLPNRDPLLTVEGPVRGNLTAQTKP